MNLFGLNRANMHAHFKITHFSLFASCSQSPPTRPSRDTDAEQTCTDQKQLSFQPKCMQCPKQRLSGRLILIVFPFLALPGGRARSTCLHRHSSSPWGAMLQAAKPSDASDHTSRCVRIYLSMHTTRGHIDTLRRCS